MLSEWSDVYRWLIGALCKGWIGVGCSREELIARNENSRPGTGLSVRSTLTFHQPTLPPFCKSGKVWSCPPILICRLDLAPGPASHAGMARVLQGAVSRGCRSDALVSPSKMR